MNISGVLVGPGEPCRTVAEMSNAHNGDFGRAVAILAAAKEGGADFAKFQAYTPAELVLLRGDGPAPEPWGSHGWTMKRLYEKAQTPLKWLPKLVQHCSDIGLPWFSSVFGAGSLAVLESLECPAYKLAALDFGRRGLLDLVRGTGRPVIRSARTKQAPTADLSLWCPAGYPQMSFGLPAALRHYDGFSYHGTDPLVPALAAAHGAQLVEVHFQLDDQPSELEAGVSLTASDFARMVTMIRTAAAVAE